MSSPEKQTCPRCGGSGIHTSPRTINGELRIMPKNCNLCHGTGQVPEASAAKPKRLTYSNACSEAGITHKLCSGCDCDCHTRPVASEAKPSHLTPVSGDDPKLINKPASSYLTAPVASEAKHTPDCTDEDREDGHIECYSLLSATPDEQPKREELCDICHGEGHHYEDCLHYFPAKPIETDSVEAILQDLVIVTDNRFGGQFKDDPILQLGGVWAKKVATDCQADKHFTVKPVSKYATVKEAIEALLAQRESEADYRGYKRGRAETLRYVLGILYEPLKYRNDLPEFQQLYEDVKSDLKALRASEPNKEGDQ